ncbi:YwdI family protein [Bacillus atrophaeus]|uniref:YwdI family protein n=1 Tax=Bacillus atrophaeus TaxID=1452 RepID=UPI001EE3A83F|nr:YwdI family protein [Bacillus atrophaeus]MCY8974959.1 YwdI family protein [Bacillus atrophaeus]MEC5221556.1 YwdI family protein [Bacillus atrophaeus]MED4578654.1 YwdI family protein [Bacillus atrophaeus]MED4799442.1 YwdI family protein [Bacillus atrophaeus]MED4808053.1 YwdI family protein [Bacillus atrophaeus]
MQVVRNFQMEDSFMNIHISALLQKMEEELKEAKTAQQDEELKQHIAVVRSLCDVVMDNSDTPRSPEASPTITASPVAAPAADPMLLEKMMGSAGLSQYRKKEKEKSEEDGNGDSLFDF